MQVLYLVSFSHWKNIMILPHFSPQAHSSKTVFGIESAKVAQVRQSLMCCSLSHWSGNSPHSTFNRLDHSADIEVFVLVNDVEFLKYARSVSELSSPFFSFLLQFISQTVSKLEEIVSGALVSVHGIHHVLEKFELILVVLVFLAVFHASHVSEWGFVNISVFFLEHLLHHHLHEHFLHHVVLRSLLLSKDKLDWGVLALLAYSISTKHGHGFEHFHCFEIFGTFE